MHWIADPSAFRYLWVKPGERMKSLRWAVLRVRAEGRVIWQRYEHEVSWQVDEW